MTAVSIMWSMLLQYALRNAAISAWKNRYHDAKYALEHDMGDAYGDFCYGVERVRIYAYHPFGGGAGVSESLYMSGGH